MKLWIQTKANDGGWVDSIGLAADQRERAVDILRQASEPMRLVERNDSPVWSNCDESGVIQAAPYAVVNVQAEQVVDVIRAELIRKYDSQLKGFGRMMKPKVAATLLDGFRDGVNSALAAVLNNLRVSVKE